VRMHETRRNPLPSGSGGCQSSFHKHSVEIHGLKEDDLVDSRMFLDLNKWTLTLLK